MTKLLLTGMLMMHALIVGWQADFATALQNAKEKHHLVLVNFSGSDWCGPCMRMHHEIFEDKTFTAMADTSLEMVNADFPRNKKNQPAKNILKQNDMLANKYDKQGSFPYTVLLNADGKVLKEWDGLPKGSATGFANQVRQICDANR